MAIKEDSTKDSCCWTAQLLQEAFGFSIEGISQKGDHLSRSPK